MTAMSALFTDFYELTMAQGYWHRGLETRAVFDYFYRRQPFGGGYAVFCGLDPLLSNLENLHFSASDLAYLETLGIFERGFLDYLAQFRFRGDIHAFAEGQIIFPQEPVLRVEATLIEAQLIEGLILNTLNFQSLIATKAARIWRASGYSKVMEFGLRRAQGRDGAVSATRAACIGGATSTSNTLAGRLYGIPVMGTMAHSWVMSFPKEIEAFEYYATIYPDGAVFLIDTYDTMASGVKNAIQIGSRLAAQGKRFGVRLDSGDIAYLARAVRAELDAAGLKDAAIVVSNELDEDIIEHLVADGAPVDSWGVGTHLVTGGKESSFTGVYKLAAIKQGDDWSPTMKVSDNPEKATNPGIKDVFRLFDDRGMAIADLIATKGETPLAGTELVLNHPSGDWRHTRVVPARVEHMLSPVMVAGHRCSPNKEIGDLRSTLKTSLAGFDGTYQRLFSPHIYKVSLSTKLKEMKLAFIDRRFGSS